MANIEEKEDCIVSEIIEQRKQSANLITSKYKLLYESKLTLKNFFILHEILMKRKKAQEKILTSIRGYMIRKNITSYLSKIKTSFIITTAIEGYDDLRMKVYFGKKEKIFDVVKDPFLNKLAIYIPRNKITKNEYKVNFISKEGTIVIDPSYFTSEENGNFVNIINFARIKKEEIEKAKENARELKFVLMYLKSEGIKFTEKGVEFEKDELGDSTASNSPQRKMKRRASMSVPFKRMMNFKKLSNLPKPKSILKLNATENIDPGLRKRRMSGMLNIKRVSFGNVEFGY
jgi:hypothetical protein